MCVCVCVCVCVCQVMAVLCEIKRYGHPIGFPKTPKDGSSPGCVWQVNTIISVS